jgi:hypothetical protein
VVLRGLNKVDITGLYESPRGFKYSSSVSNAASSEVHIICCILNTVDIGTSMGTCMRRPPPRLTGNQWRVVILKKHFEEVCFFSLKVHKNENFFGFDFEFCTISMLVMHK